jgi:hypothetical protein
MVAGFVFLRRTFLEKCQARSVKKSYLLSQQYYLRITMSLKYGVHTVHIYLC